MQQSLMLFHLSLQTVHCMSTIQEIAGCEHTMIWGFTSRSYWGCCQSSVCSHLVFMFMMRTERYSRNRPDQLNNSLQVQNSEPKTDIDGRDDQQIAISKRAKRALSQAHLFGLKPAKALRVAMNAALASRKSALARAAA